MAQSDGISRERRSAERFLLSLPVETNRGPGVTRDLSVSGLCLVTDEPLAVGDHLQLTMNIPDGETSVPLRLVLQGRVVRIEAARGVESTPEAVGVGIALDEEGRYLSRAS